jgi:hypothetical protein
VPAGSSPIERQTLPQLANVTLDPGHVARQVIGPAGGTVETADAQGTTYRLSIPAGALVQETEITAVPVTAIAGLPKEAAIAGGVHFLPEGLSFWAPAELTITLATMPPGGVLPFAYAGDLAEPHGYPAIVDAATVTVGIIHFSGYAMLKATEHAQTAAELGLILPWEPPSGSADQALGVVAAVLGGYSIGTPEESINAAMTNWLDTELRPLVLQFRGIGTWSFTGPFGTTGDKVFASFTLWNYVERLVGLSDITFQPSLKAALESIAISAFTHALSVTNTGCASSDSYNLVWRIPEEFAWQDLAARVGVAGRDPTLALAFVEEHLCLKVVFHDTEGTTYPSSQPGQSGTLSIRVGYSVDGGPARFDTYFQVVVTPHGTDPATAVDDDTTMTGTYSHAFAWKSDSPELRLDVQACFPGTPACQVAYVVRGMADMGRCVSTIDAGGQHVEGDGQVVIDNATVGASAVSTHIGVRILKSMVFKASSSDVLAIGGPAEVDILIQESNASHQFDDRLTRASGFKGSMVSVTIDGGVHRFPGDLALGHNVIPLTRQTGELVMIAAVTLNEAKAGDEVSVHAGLQPKAGSTWSVVSLCG